MARTHTPTIPTLYKLFFLYIEPISTIIGAYYAFFLPSTYLYLTHRGPYLSSVFSPPVATITALAQLANLYALFAVNEALVLRAAYEKGKGYNLRVWRTLLFGLLLADMGHLCSVKETGTFEEVYLGWRQWNSMAWGNVGFVYLGALTRICFLCGVGLG